MNRIHIIMATYNGENYVSQQIESILNSEGVDVFVTVYDDGSKDATLDIVKKFVEKDPGRIELIQNEKNMGLTRNFLQGLLTEKFDYVMFSDQDDVWKPDKVKKTYDFMRQTESKESKNQPIVVFTDAVIVDETLKEINPSFHRSGGYDTTKLDFAHMLMENKMMGCTMMLNRAVTQKVNALPEHARYHDWWLALIASCYGKIAYLKEGTILYRQHGNNIVGDVSYGSYVKKRMRALKQQKSAIEETIGQARELYEMYGDDMPDASRKILKDFVQLSDAGWFKRRRLLFKHGFFKSGFARNIGLLLII